MADAGDINLESGIDLLMNESNITTEASLASGGDIELTTQDLIFVSGSDLKASVQGGTETKGGNINIDPEFVVIKQSNLLAEAEQGDGGNIIIQGGVVLIDPASTISVTSRFGRSGIIRIESPLLLNGLFQLLRPEIIRVAELYACTSETGGKFSSFVHRRRGGGPAEPGFPLPSPVENLGMATGSAISELNSYPPFQAWRLGMLEKTPRSGFLSHMELECGS